MSTRSAFDETVFNFHWTSGSGPSPGGNLLITNLPNTKSELMALSFQFGADANVADRIIRVLVVHAAYSVVLGAAGVVMTATESRRIIVGQHGHTTEVDNGDNLCIAIPSWPFLLEGDQIVTDIQGLQAGDAIGSIVYGIKFWTYEQ